MLTREELQSSWKQLKGQIRERWGQITDDELQQAQGSGEQLLGLLQKKTGQSRQELEQFLQSSIEQGQDLLTQGQRYARQTAENVRDYSQQMGQSLKEGYEAVEQRVSQGVDGARELIRTRPVESLTTAFATGMLTGVILSLLLRSQRA